MNPTHRRIFWLAAAGLSGLLLTAALLGGLHPPAQAATAAAPRTVVINEVAWGGTVASPFDEWIELHNTTGLTVSLEGWHLVDDDSLNIALTGAIPPHGYYLIERTNDDTVSDIPADWYGSFGAGGLSNTGEVLTLTDGLDNVVDTANGDGGAWPAGSDSPDYRSMERRDPLSPDTADNWCANDGQTRNGHDADGNPLNGTPKAQNSCYTPPSTPFADLTVAKSGPATVYSGGLLTYRIAVGNIGDGVATAVRLTDTLPGGTEFITQTGPYTFARAGRTLTWAAGDLPTGTLDHITVTVRVTATAPLTLTNCITGHTTAS